MTKAQPEICQHASSELLPWYLNGTLEHHERDSVASHLETCPV